MVLEVPRTEGDLGIFGSIVDPFMVPLEDVGDKFFPNSNWTRSVDEKENKTQFTYVDEDVSYDWETRAQTFHWVIWASK
jgi:hypothetical protein